MDARPCTAGLVPKDAASAAHQPVPSVAACIVEVAASSEQPPPSEEGVRTTEDGSEAGGTAPQQQQEQPKAAPALTSMFDPQDPNFHHIPEHVRNDPEEVRRRNVYVAGVPTDFGEEHFRQLMGEFGPLYLCRVITKSRRVKRAQKAYAFALFQEVEHAEAAVEGLNGLTIHDHPLTVRIALTTALKTTDATTAADAAAGGKAQPGTASGAGHGSSARSSQAAPQQYGRGKGPRAPMAMAAARGSGGRSRFEPVGVAGAGGYYPGGFALIPVQQPPHGKQCAPYTMVPVQPAGADVAGVPASATLVQAPAPLQHAPMMAPYPAHHGYPVPYQQQQQQMLYSHPAAAAAGY